MKIDFRIKKIENSENYKCEIYYGKKLISPKELLREKHQWKKIAEENPLNGVAFIQALALAGDVESAFLQCIYQTYRKFLDNGETYQFEKLIELVLERSLKPSLKFYIATYIKSLLEEEETKDKNVIKAGEILHKLIPGFEKVLMSDIYRVHKEQKIRTSEMQKPHNAFPDLVKFEGAYYIAFREAESHVSHGNLGVIRILKGSYNEKIKTWKFENAGLLSDSKYDLRDPRFFLNANKKLMMVIGGSKISKKDMTTKMVPHVGIFENDTWKIQPAVLESEEFLKKGQWIWRVTWNPSDNMGYALSYGITKELYLLQTNDGVHFKKIIDLSTDQLDEPLNEATIGFKPDGAMIALIRTQKHRLVATSTKLGGYKDWEYTLLPFRLGGPNFLIKPDEEMIAGTRHFFLEKDNSLDMGTVIAYMDEKRLIPLLRLKSEQDNSYPGMVLEESGDISFLYYSKGSDDQSCDLYIVRIKHNR